MASVIRAPSVAPKEQATNNVELKTALDDYLRRVCGMSEYPVYNVTRMVMQLKRKYGGDRTSSWPRPSTMI